ncbi:hypothetical protein DSO57_1017959 [Entomophthora muscae]|uniref:Uncharacterized protein n=1 Tax=Entomophthora muscae TaxID=34485 RepID=A0ACC2SHI7_9FUNG|nr:hypothetical protein DSO57_1017959 [Entomophthora muscae]
MDLFSKLEVHLFVFLILHNLLVPLMLVVSDPTVLALLLLCNRSRLHLKLSVLLFKEDISDPPIFPTVLNLGNGPCLVAYLMSTPNLEQVMAVALGIAHEGAIPACNYSLIEQNTTS